MTYFQLFGIPVQLQVDTKALTQKFFELSKGFHPDYFAQSDSNRQLEALQSSALLNEAWNTFKNPDATIRYVLIEKALLEAEEKYTLPPHFLMEMMEINEQAVDVQGDVKATESLGQQIDEFEQRLYDEVKSIVEGYKDNVTSTAELLKVKDYYFKKKYLQRIRQQLKGKQ